MARSKKEEKRDEAMEEDLKKNEDRASQAMKLAMDTLNLGLETVRVTHRTAKRLRASVEELDFPTRPHLAVAKK